MKFRPPTIEDVGLRNYLNQTASKHNDSDYDDFVKRVELSEPSTVIARAFKVSRPTIIKWIMLYEKSLSNE